MTSRVEFEASEIEAAKQEALKRLEKTKAYKKTWAAAKHAADPEAVKARNAANMREWRAKNRERAREISRAGSAKYAATSPATRRKSARDFNARKKAELLAFFGGVCARCGFLDPRALQMDHLQGDGKKYRDAGQHGLYARYKMMRDDPSQARATFQLLCANCNCIKRDEDYEYGRRAILARVLESAGRG
jgi:5-methylcytosine-specific restriction endonuclease McrA